MALEQAVEWTKEVFMPLGPFGLFILAFIEASFFPVPPDALLIPLVIASPESGIFLALITTVGSVAGALFGYEAGRRGGRPVMEHMVSEKNVRRVEKYYEKYGVYAVGIAGLSPVPYKVFAISSGVFDMKLRTFVWVSALSRGMRFFGVAILFMVYGQRILGFVESYFGALSLALAICLAAAYIVWKQWM